jgi:hypothetical protein
MAVAIVAKPPSAAVDGPYKELTEEARDRLDTCEAQKREFDLDIRESYFFTAPHRAREIRSAQAISPTKPRDADELQTGIAMELCKDFTTVAVNSFMPPSEPWAEQRAGMFLPEEVKAQAKKEAEKQDPIIFEAIRASNLYEEIPKAFSPDLSIGTTALIIDDVRPAENIVVQALPLHELEINNGPFGAIDDRFAVRHTRYRHVKALLGEAIYKDIDAHTRASIEDSKNRQQSCIIRWGWWRKWDDLRDVVWQHVVMLDLKVIHAAPLVGVGSCPLIPIRFNPSPEWAYGTGPTIESLPDFRQLDDLEAGKIEHIDKTLNPPMSYPDDSFTNIAGGVETSKWYPIRPGTEGAIKRMIETGSMEPAIFEVSEKERALRHRYYLDWPEQRGDTPPTATQWLDEMQLAQRRFGTPGGSFWREGPAEIFLRYKYLLTQRGLIAPIRVDGKTISLQPYNPAQRAAEQQEVAMFGRFAEIGAPLFQEEWKLETDGGKTLQNLADIMRVNKIWARRPAGQIEGFVKRIRGLFGGQPPGPPGGGEPAA